MNRKDLIALFQDQLSVDDLHALKDGPITFFVQHSGKENKPMPVTIMQEGG